MEKSWKILSTHSRPPRPSRIDEQSKFVIRGSSPLKTKKNEWWKMERKKNGPENEGMAEGKIMNLSNRGQEQIRQRRGGDECQHYPPNSM
jgi:hypothetical protein